MKAVTFNQAVKLYGAKVEKTYSQYDQSTSWDVDAPDGKQWIASGSTVLCAVHYGYVKGSLAEAKADLLDRMNYGLEDCSE